MTGTIQPDPPAGAAEGAGGAAGGRAGGAGGAGGGDGAVDRSAITVAEGTPSVRSLVGAALTGSLMAIPPDLVST